MNILLVSATSKEIEPQLKRCEWPSDWGPVYSTSIGDHSVDILMTGPGMVSAAYHLGSLLSMRRYDLAVQAGIAGSFSSELPIGAVVHVTSDILGDFGAASPEGFIPAATMGLLESAAFDSDLGHLIETSGLNWPAQIQPAKGITVQRVSGIQEEIDLLRKTYDCQVESMEGAAFYFACRMHQIPATQLRAVSNFVEPRNKENWNIPLAVEQLDVALQLLFAELL